MLRYLRLKFVLFGIFWGGPCYSTGGERRKVAVELGGPWSHVTKGSYKTSAIFYHVAIGSLITSALAALLRYLYKPTAPPIFLSPFLSLALYLH